MNEKINCQLLKYNSYELRQAANYIDIENKRYPLLNILTIMKKLEYLNATLELNKESGFIKFWSNEKNDYVRRNFKSASELSIALSLGPIDIYWSDSLYVKTEVGVFKIEIINCIRDKNQIFVRNLENDRTRYIWLNGAEKILANSKEGLTAGQLKLKK